MRRQLPMEAKPAKQRFSGFDRAVIHYGVGLMIAVVVFAVLYTKIQDQGRVIDKLREGLENKDQLAEQSIKQLSEQSALAQRSQIMQSSLTELDKKALGVWMSRQLRTIDMMFVPKSDIHVLGSGNMTRADFDQAEKALAEDGHTPATVATGGVREVGRKK